jgi:hypothetical protein
MLKEAFPAAFHPRLPAFMGTWAVPLRLESRVSPRVVAGLLSALLHLALLFLLLSGGQYDGSNDGETPITRLLLFESRNADPREGVEAPPLEPSVPTMNLPEQLSAENSEPPSPLFHDLDSEPAEPILAPPAEITAATEAISTETIDAPSTFVMPQAERLELAQRLARLAEELTKTSRAQVTWEQDGKQYNAELVLERAQHGTEFDRVIADVSAEDRGKQLTTRIMLKRLAFSHFTQMVDRWDPMVQLHDDEITGRVHINSRFNLLFDRKAAPRFFGKVTTAASSFETQSLGMRRDADIFRGGIETRAGRITLPEEVQPFAWAPRDGNARIHELVNDTQIRFFADGSYTWRDRNAQTAEYRNEPSELPVYFIATRRATLYVQGVVSGKVLVYSPQSIVVEGSITYAHDPRHAPDSRDYLGLVCDRYIEVAPPHVTGPGDLDIQAAIFAGRRFIVRSIDHPRSATLRIFGSLAAGSVSASEPRYATKVEYDNRLEQLRPPGFPSTNRFTAENWDGLWTEASGQATSDAF